MKNVLEKILWGSIMLVSLTCTLTAGLMITDKKAAPGTPVASAQVDCEAPAAQSGKVYAERSSHVIVYYYRKHDGWIQRRLWDRTIGRWVDPRWYNVQRY